METHEQRPTGSWIANTTFLSIFDALFAVLFITLLMGINVSTQMEEIEEKLKYMPPQTTGTEIPAEKVAAGQTVYVPA